MPFSVPVNLNATNNFGVASFIVDVLPGSGTHTSISNAISDIVTLSLSNQTIFIRPGTYTENFTLPATINLTAFDCDALTPNVTINGKITCNDVGSRTISGIRLQTNSDFFLVVSGTLATIVNLTNCYFNCTNNTGISYTVINSSSSLNIIYSICDILTPGITFFLCSSTGMLRIDFSRIINTGNSSTASTNSAADFRSRHSIYFMPISISSTGNITSLFVDIETQNQNTASLTLSGSGTSAIRFSNYASGSASAVSVGSGVTLNMSDSVLASTNTNVVTGAGTLLYSNLAMPNSSVMSVTTQTPYYTQLGKYKASGQPMFSAYLASTINNVTGDGTSYTLGTDALTKLYDIGNNFNTNGTFTAPVTGYYHFDFGVLALQTVASMSAIITLSVVGTSSGNYSFGNYGTIGAAGNFPIGSSRTIFLTATDTVTVFVNFAGGTKVVGIYGGASDPRTWFSGQLIG